MTTSATSAAPATTVACYEFWDRVFRRAGWLDYTEGLYDGDPALPYEQAQQRQINYLLDQAGCTQGTRILDVGCGNGTLLDEVRARGAHGVGVTISPEQVQCCRGRGLDVHLLNYKFIDDSWNRRFDAVIANGSIEHFVQAPDVVAGRGDDIYRHFFSICHRVIDRDSASRRLVNTTIHFRDFRIEPADVVRSPWSFHWFSDTFHYLMLVRGFGGHYPQLGQFERCATGYFRLASQRDATQDYHLTSEQWLRHGKRSLASLRQWGRLLPFAVRHPRHAATMMFSLYVAQSWNWQFRGAHPPMQHLWQTWEYVDKSSAATAG